MAVGLDLKWQNGENDEKSGSEIEFVREYLSMYHHNRLKGGLRAMPSGVYLAKLYIHEPCVALEWRQQVGFQTE